MSQQLHNPSPVVSIGMPVYNGEKYIKEAIDSLLSQTFTDFELIISDNCSTDETEVICLEYKNLDKRVRYTRQSHNIGASKNFMGVLNMARGRYFMWAACDDTWDDDWIERLLHTLTTTNHEAVYGQVIPVNDTLQPYPHIAVGQTFRFTGSRFFRKCKYYLDYEGRGKANLIYALYIIEAIRKIDLESSYDYAMIFNLLSEAKFESVKNVYTYKRIHNESLDKSAIQNNKLTVRLRRTLSPIPFKLFLEYFKYCNYFEKVSLIILFPVKSIITYFWTLVITTLRLKSN